MMTSTVRKFGVGVASLALVAGVAGPAFADEAPKPLDGGWDRIASSKPANDRIDTAVAVANAAYATNKSAAKSVYIVNYMANIDAATAGQLTDGPILLVKDDSRVLNEVKDAIKTFTSATTVYAVGGSKVVSDEMLKAVAGSKATGRIAGEDRYDTAVKVAERVAEISPEKSKRLYLSRGDIAIDALSAGTLDDGPVLLVKNGTLTEMSKKYIEAKKPTKVVGLGGASYVPDAVLSEAKLPGIQENPGAATDQRKALLRKFQENRTLYLGNNDYKGETSVVLKNENHAGTNPVRNDTTTDSDLLGTSSTNAAARWQGYKAQLAELKQRMNDIVAPTVRSLENKAQADINNAAAATSEKKITLEAFYASSVSKTNLIASAKALYGVDLAGTGGTDALKAASVKDYFVLEANPAHENDDTKAFVTAINWDKVAEDSSYKAEAKAAADKVKKYKDNYGKNLTDLFANPASTTADASNKLAAKRNLVTGDIDSLNGNANTARLMIVKNTLDSLIGIASSNASTTKAAMEDALSKIDEGTNYARLYGKDRYETAAQISAYRRTPKEWGGLGKSSVTKGGDLNKVYIANGVTMVDALVAGVLSQGPILLADANGNLPEATMKELKGIGGSEGKKRGDVPFVQLIGGKSAVPDSTGPAAVNALKEGDAAKPEETLAAPQLSAPSAPISAAGGNTTFNITNYDSSATYTFVIKNGTGTEADKLSATHSAAAVTVTGNSLTSTSGSDKTYTVTVIVTKDGKSSTADQEIKVNFS